MAVAALRLLATQQQRILCELDDPSWHPPLLFHGTVLLLRTLQLLLRLEELQTKARSLGCPTRTHRRSPSPLTRAVIALLPATRLARWYAMEGGGRRSIANTHFEETPDLTFFFIFVYHQVLAEDPHWTPPSS